jgi:non-ribosomal peptide synthase protein (TIGR01720 family)
MDLVKTSPYRLWTDNLHSMAEEDTDWLERQSAFWRRALALANPLSTSLFDAPAKTPAVPSSVSVRLSAPQTEMLLDEALHAPFRTTVPDVLLTALLLAFTRWTGTPLLRVDLFAEARDKLFEDIDLSHTVGCCVSKYPVVLQLTQNASSSDRFLRDALLNVKEAVHLVPNQGMGYGMLRYMSKMQDALLPEDTHDSEVCFRYAGKPSAVQDSSLFSLVQGGNGIPQHTAKAIASFIDIDALIGADGKLQLVFSFRKSRFQEATITRLSSWYIEELELLLNHMTQQKDSRFPTPSDFSLAHLTQAELAHVFTQGRPFQSVMDVYVASQLQQGMLFHALGDKQSGTYTNQLVFDIKGDIVMEKLKRAFVATVQHFPVLRTEYVWEGLAETHSIVKNTAVCLLLPQL